MLRKLQEKRQDVQQLPHAGRRKKEKRKKRSERQKKEREEKKEGLSQEARMEAHNLQHYLDAVRAKKPLVHCITNYVTVNDVANLLLASGASPVMADAIEEVEEMVAIADALLINIGTLNARTVTSMLAAGKRANAKAIPVVLDPVGVGATSYRTEVARRLLDNVQFTLVRGNISEIQVLGMGSGTSKGVDAADHDLKADVQGRISLAQRLAERYGCMVAISGAQDILVGTDRSAATCANGCAAMQDITGSGCMLGALTAAFLAPTASTEQKKNESYQASALAALAAMGVCGEQAWKRAEAEQLGNASLRSFLIDAMYRLERLDEQAQVSIMAS